MLAKHSTKVIEETVILFIWNDAMLVVTMIIAELVADLLDFRKSGKSILYRRHLGCRGFNQTAP